MWKSSELALCLHIGWKRTVTSLLLRFGSCLQLIEPSTWWLYCFSLFRLQLCCVCQSRSSWLPRLLYTETMCQPVSSDQILCSDVIRLCLKIWGHLCRKSCEVNFLISQSGFYIIGTQRQYVCFIHVTNGSCVLHTTKCLPFDKFRQLLFRAKEAKRTNPLSSISNQEYQFLIMGRYDILVYILLFPMELDGFHQSGKHVGSALCTSACPLTASCLGI